MNYRELQQSLKAYRASGLTIVKLNQKTAVLQAEYNRIQAQQAQQQQQDPVIQMQQQELQLKAQDLQIRAQKTQADIAIEQQRLELEKEKIMSHERLEGAKLGAQATKDKQKAESDKVVQGIKLGMDAEFKKNADMLLRLSNMTLPHGLVRVILAEQLYRAWSILRNHPYHRV